MSALCAASPRDTNAANAPPAPVEFRYTQTESFVSLLAELRASLLISTYQANKLLVARATASGLSMLVRNFDRPMGMAVDSSRLALGTRDGVVIASRSPLDRLSRETAPKLAGVGPPRLVPAWAAAFTN